MSENENPITPPSENTVSAPDTNEVELPSNPNVTLDQPCFAPLDKNDERAPLYGMGMSRDAMLEAMGAAPNFRAGTSIESMNWAYTINIGTQEGIDGDNFIKSFDRPGADWKQYVEVNGRKIRTLRPKIGDGNGSLLAGSAAIYKMQALLGLGASLTIPLWSSGLWITLKAPSDSELLYLDTKLAQEKSIVGQNTNGAAFSNTQVYMFKHVFQLIKENIYETNLKDAEPEDIDRLILITDLFPLINIFAACIYPDGFPIDIPCMANPDTCNRVESTKILLTKCIWTDNNSISDYQREFMANHKVKRSVKDIEEYQKQSISLKSRVVSTISDNANYVFRVPNVEDYISAGERWIDSLIASVNRAVSKDASSQEKENLVIRQSRLAQLREYSHCISSIVVDNGEQGIEDRPTLEQIFDLMSSDMALTEKFVDEVNKFLDDATVSVVGYPNFHCPVCKKPHDPEATSSIHPLISPLDALKTFFTLRLRRLSKEKRTKIEG